MACPLFHSPVCRIHKHNRPSSTALAHRRQRPVIVPVSRVRWDDVERISSTGPGDASDLRGFLRRVRECNRGSELRSQFVPFVVDGEAVGYVSSSFIEHLSKYQDVFTFATGNESYEDCHSGGFVTLHPSLEKPEDRTLAVGDVVRSLGDLIPGICNELLPVASSFGSPAVFYLERAATPYFGVKAYGVHLNGYVDKDGEKFLWIGKRSVLKPTYPEMLDHLVAGGLLYGITCKDNVVKECQEEAGIPKSISDSAISVGAVSYHDIDGFQYKRDTLFCYDLKLPTDFIPRNEDGEVDSFRLLPVALVASIIRRTQFFKTNCCLVLIDFLIRHGFITPDHRGYLELLQSLRGGEFS